MNHQPGHRPSPRESEEGQRVRNMINAGCSWVGHPETAADQAHHVQAVSSRPADTKALSWPGKSFNVLEPVAGRDLNPVRDAGPGWSLLWLGDHGERLSPFDDVSGEHTARFGAEVGGVVRRVGRHAVPEDVSCIRSAVACAGSGVLQSKNRSSSSFTGS